MTFIYAVLMIYQLIPGRSKNLLCHGVFLCGHLQTVASVGRKVGIPNFPIGDWLHIAAFKFIMYGFLDNVVIDKWVCGAVLKVKVMCNSCGASYHRCTSEKRGKIFYLNYLMSGLFIFGGNLIAKICRQVSTSLPLLKPALKRLNSFTFLYLQSI